MSLMTTLHVFTNESGKFGNPVGIIIDDSKPLKKTMRQQIALNSGLSEIVFINNVKEGNISFFSPTGEIPFAGHAAVGSAYFLNHKFKIPVTQLSCLKTLIGTWVENDLTWVRGNLSVLPSWNYEQLSSAAQVDKVTQKEAAMKNHTVVWSWIDKDSGLVRARTFASDWGISEDEANGSGSMRLAVNLGKSLIIRHGKGSVIYARPSSQSAYAEVGGRVK